MTDESTPMVDERSASPAAEEHLPPPPPPASAPDAGAATAQSRDGAGTAGHDVENGAGGPPCADAAPPTPADLLVPVPEDFLHAPPEDMVAVLEAVCYALNRPLTVAEAAAVVGRSQADVAAAVELLASSLRGRGLMLQRHQGELQLVTRPEVAWAVHRALNPERPGRLSRAALETLAIIAYRQPVTRAGVEAIRGVNCEGVLDSLERRGLVAEVGRQESPGHPRLFGTTLHFLRIVGLERIEDLPALPGGSMPELPAGPWDDGDGDEEDGDLDDGAHLGGGRAESVDVVDEPVDGATGGAASPRGDTPWASGSETRPSDAEAEDRP